MSQFNPEIFISKPDSDVFFDLTKGELITLGRYLQLEVKKLMPKIIIQQMILSQLVDTKIFGITELDIMIEIIKWKIRQKHWREKKRNNKKNWKGKKRNDKD